MSIKTGECNLDFISTHRFVGAVLFSQVATTITRAEFNGWRALQSVWTDDAILETPFGGNFEGIEAILEYFILPNPNFDWTAETTTYEISTRPFVIESFTFNETSFNWKFLITQESQVLSTDGTFLPGEFTFNYEDCISTKSHLATINLNFPSPDVSDSYLSDMCTHIQSFCIGNLVQYESHEDCMDYVGSMPMYNDCCPWMEGETQNCISIHAHLIYPFLRPEIHCFHVGKGLADPYGKIKCSMADCSCSTTDMEGGGVELTFLKEPALMISESHSTASPAAPRSTLSFATKFVGPVVVVAGLSMLYW